jgi:hypothetical protein
LVIVPITFQLFIGLQVSFLGFPASQAYGLFSLLYQAIIAAKTTSTLACMRCHVCPIAQIGGFLGEAGASTS